jgi:Domain of unknown function (DUF4169)
MSAELINLRRVKKNLAREEAAKNAEANRIKFGRTKIEKKVARFETAKIAKLLDGKKLGDT